MTNEVTPLQAEKRKGTAGGADTCWRVAIIASLTTFFTTVTIKNSGIVFIGLIERLTLNRGQAAWPISIQEGAILTAGLLVHLLQQKMSIDQIALLGTFLTWSGLVASAFTPSITWMSVTYGIVHGCGTGMMLVTLAILVLEYFQEYRGAATGIRYAGETFTAILFPYILLYLRRSFGFNGMLLLLGGIVMNSSPLMLLLKLPYSSANKQDANRKPTPSWSCNIKDNLRYSTSKIPNGNGTMPINCEIEDRTKLLVMVRKPIFYVIILSGVIGNYSENIFLTTIIDFATDSGVSLATATSIILYTSATDLLGRLALPFFADKTSVTSKSLVLCCHFLLGLFMTLLPHHAMSFPLLLSISLCIAMFIACVITMKSLLIADYFGYEQISVIYGLSGLVALPLFIGNPRILGSADMDGTTPLSRKRSQPQNDGLDTSWHVAIFAALATFMATAAHKSTGVIFVEVMAEFRINKEMAAWPTSAHAAALNFAGIVVRILQKKLTLVQIMKIGSVLTWAGLIASAFTTSIFGLSLTYGAIHGSGTGIMIVTLATIVVAYFDKYRGIASGIRFVGETLSSIVFPYLLLHLQDSYDFQGMLLILGGITIHTTAFTITLKEPQWASPLQNSKQIPERQDSGNVPSSEDSHSRTPIEAPTNAVKTTDNPPGLRATLLNPIFYVIVISSATTHYSQVVFATTIVDYGKDKGAPLVRATSIIVYSSATDLIGRLVLPLLADRNYLRRSSLVMWCHLLLGLAMTLLPYVTSFAWLLLVSFCVTLFIACLLTMKVVLMADYLGLGQVPACYGAVGLVVLPLLLTAPRLVGYFRDFHGMYDNLYRLLGGVNFFAGLLLLLVVCCEHCGRLTH